MKSSFISSEKEIKNLPSLIPKLKQSLKLQKELIKEIEQKLQILANEENPNKIKTKTSKDFFLDVLPNIMKELGIPFVHNFIDNQFIFQYLIGIYLDERHVEKIKLIFKSCMDAFREVSSNDELSKIREYIFDSQIISEENEIINKPTEEGKNYENIYSLIKGLKDLKELGFDKEKYEELEKKYTDLRKEIKILNYQLTIQKNQAGIEFFNELMKEVDNNFEKIKLEKPKDDKSSEINEIIENNKEENIINQPLDQRTFFYSDEKLKETPNEVIEFKNFSYPLTNHMEEIKRQICGFLNSRGGRLYIGINAKNRVRGLVLDSKARDSTRIELVNLTSDFYPNCRIDKINVFIIPVKDPKTKEFIKKRYVIKIRVYPGEPEFLYSMTSKGYRSIVRRNNQIFELNSTEIYNEIIARDELKKIKNQDNAFIKEMNIRDPEPEKINEDEDDENDNLPFELDLNKHLNDKMKKKIQEKGRPKKKKKNNNKSNMVRDGPSYTVKITNIDESLPINEVNRHFNGCKCYSQKVLKGYGFLNFSSLKDAKECIARHNGDKLGSKNIKLTLQNTE